MSRGLLGFAAGFGTGYFGERNRKEDRARLDRIDERNARTAELQQRSAEMQIEDAEQRRADEKTLRDSASTVSTEQGFASGAPGGQIFSADQGQAEQLAQINADAAELEGRPAPTSKAVTAATGFTGGARPAIGAAGMNADAMNTPEGRIKRQVAALNNMGRVSQATELETKFTTQQAQLYDAQRTAIAGQFEKVLYNDGVDAALKLYDSYNDGFTVAHAPNTNGGGKITRLDKDGKELGSMTYTNADDLNNQVRAMMFPDKARESRAAAAAEKAKADARIHSTKPGEILYDNNFKEIARNDNLTSADVAQQRLLSGGGGGTGGSGGRSEKVPPTAIERMRDVILTASEKAGADSKLSPDQLTAALAGGTEIMRRNSEVDPDVAASVAIQMMRNPAAGTPRLDSGGRLVRVVKDATSGRDVDVGDVDAQALSKEERSAVRQQAAQLMLTVESQIPGSQGLVQRAAFGDETALKSLADQLLKAQEAEVRKVMPNATPAQVTERATQLVNGTLPALQSQLNAIRQFGEAPRPPRNTEPPAAPGARPSRASAAAPEPGFTDPESMVFEGRQVAERQPAPAAAPRAGAPDLSRSPRSMEDDYRSPVVKTVLRERVRQAGEGGEPLTPVENLRARQLGLLR